MDEVKAERAFRDAVGIVYFLGGLNLIVGFLSFYSDFIAQLASGPTVIVFGLLFLWLGTRANRYSISALWVALAILGIETLLTLLSMVAGGDSGAGMGFMIFRFLCMVWIARGISAFDRI